MMKSETRIGSDTAILISNVYALNSAIDRREIAL